MSLMSEKKYRVIFYALITIFIGFFAYFATSNLIFLLICSASVIIYFIFYEVKYAKKYYAVVTNEKDLNAFIHHFLVVYIVDYDVDKALLNAKENASNKLQEEMALNQEYSSLEQLEKLKTIFPDYFYQLFIDVISSHSYDAINYLNEENLKRIEFKKTRVEIFKKAVIEFMLLWLCAFVMLIIMRLAIRNYFQTILTSPFYLIALSVFFLFFLFSLHLTLYSHIKKEKI